MWLLFACDHRDSFRSLLRRVAGSDNHDVVVQTKALLLEGFAAAVTGELPPGAAVLIDEEYGSTLIPAIRSLGAGVVVPVERSGQAELQLEYGDRFGEHITSMAPDAVKVLLRWDPHGNDALNARQGMLLEQLSDWTHLNGVTLIVELLTPPIPASNERARSMALAIDQLRGTGTRPDIWKVEGLDSTADCEIVAAAIGRGDSAARAIVLGRGVPLDRAEAWLLAAAPLPTFTGFAIGKTLWQEPLESHLTGATSQRTAIDEIARRYHHLVTVWSQSSR